MQKTFLLLALLVLLTGCTESSTPINNENTPSEKTNITTTTSESTASEDPSDTTTPVNYYKVTSVVDGDTIKVDIDGKTETIRLIGIDTPETVDPRKEVQCFGKEASNKAKEWLSGKMVQLEADATQGERDKYDRLLRYVRVKDGLFYNLEIIKQGYAHEYTYNTPYKYQAEFKTAEKYATDNKLGLWADNTCNGDTTKSATKPTPTPTPTPTPLPTPIPTPPVSNNNFSCSIPKTCGQMKSCEEAYFYLNVCGDTKRDGDKDGIPCEDICE